MKPRALLAFLAAAALPASAVPAAAEAFVPIKPEYKKPREVPETFFNPFRAAAASGEGGGQRRDPSLSAADAVLAAVAARGVSGVTLGPAPADNRAIVGDQVFAPGDTLEFPPDKAGPPVPLVPGSVVVLREVGHDRLVFDVQGEGESGQQASFPLRRFWQP